MARGMVDAFLYLKSKYSIVSHVEYIKLSKTTIFVVNTLNIRCTVMINLLPVQR